MSLFAELQRRSVFKVAAAYLVVAWLVIQVAATVAPQMGLPDWTPRMVTLVVMLGFPLALVLAWVFDVTPEGVKVDPAPMGNKRMFAIAAVLSALAIGWFLRGPGAGDDGASRTAIEGAAARSIAVLPFANMSGDPSHEYFSDGISEEILNVLARTPELSVAARTSSFAYKGKVQDIPQIARELKVRMVLEGSVRKQGERVRITAQLIDAETGYHAWSQTYDRELKDIFAIQDEIARAIGDELKVRVGGANAGATVGGTTDVVAHDHYLRGLALWQVREEDALFASIASFDAALAADPGFAQAWGAKAMVYAVLWAYSNRLPPEEVYGRMLDAAQRALAIDPTLAEAYMAMGTVAAVQGRRDTGVALLRRAIEFSPSAATAHQWLGTILMEMGRIDESLAELARAAELDPRSLVIASNRASVLTVAGREEEAIAACAPTLEYAPKAVLCVSVMAVASLQRGDRARARTYYDLWAKNLGRGTGGQVAAFFEVLEGRGDRQAFARTLAAFPIRSSRDPASGNMFGDLDVPFLLMVMGEPAMALDHIERSSKGDHVDLTWALQMPAFDPIRCEARFVAAVARIHIKDSRFAKVCGAAGAGA